MPKRIFAKPGRGDLEQSLYQQLVKDELLWSGERQKALEAVTRLTSEILKVSRSSIWTLNKDGTLLCLNLYEQDKNKHLSGLELSQNDFPAYFKALDEGRIIDAHEAQTDPRTRDFTHSYLKPLGIGAMLDATLRKGGKTWGVVCLEHIGGPRLWTGDEKSATLSLADLVSQLLVHHDLAETKNRYESILSNMPSATYRCQYDDRWTMDYISPGITNITGYTPLELIDNHSLGYGDIIHPDDRDTLRKTLDSRLKTHEDFKLEYRIIHRNGSIRWVSEFGRGVYNAENEAVSLDGVVNDITQQKLAETTHREQNEIVLQLSQGLATKTNEEFFRTLTRELATVLQVDHAIIARCPNEVLKDIETLSVWSIDKHQDNFFCSRTQSPCEQVLEQGQICFPSKVRTLFPEDDLLEELGIEGYLGERLQTSDGKVLGLIVVMHRDELRNIEITAEVLKIFAARASTELERQNSEQALRKSKTHYQSLFESAADAIFLLNSDLNCMDCNPAAINMFACDREEMLERGPVYFSPRVQPDGRETQEFALEKIQAAMLGKPQQFEWQHCNKNGQAFDAEVSLNRVVTEEEVQLLAQVRDISERKQADSLIQKQSLQLQTSIEKLSHQALHDTLTNLPNRSALHTELKEQIGNEQPLSLMLIDLDRFKEVNDTLGHRIGDILIKALGPRIKEILHDQGVFISRLGGDEFALLIEGVTEEKRGSELAQRILDAIRTPFTAEGIALEIGASIGIVTFNNESINEHELLRRADIAMYKAKKSGCGYCIYTDDIDNHSKEKLAFMLQLRNAIAEDEFILHFQPKLNLTTQETEGLEALIRWQHPKLGLVFPDQFIHLAEMSDLIHPLTNLVIQKALRQLKQWNTKFNTRYSVAVNISTRNLLDSDFPRELQSLLYEFDMDPGCLELEITESALIHDPVRAREILMDITGLGVKLSIDDFGTGYSSLAYLKQLPIQTLKIDRSFVMDMEEGKQDELIVNSTINLAHNLGLQVVAEGVENASTLGKLIAMGCDYAQGYHISRPQAAQALEDQLKPQSQSS